MRYTEGILGNGAVLLEDGEPITISKVLELLNKKYTPKEVVEKLELMFDEYHSRQLELSDKQNPEYYLMMGKANGVGEVIDLLNENLK